MFKSIIIAVSALAASVAAVPTPGDGTEPLAFWPAVNVEQMCSPGGCSSSFNMTAPPSYVEGAPAFNVLCKQVSSPGDWVLCSRNGEQQAASNVYTLWQPPSTEKNTRLAFSHTWLEGKSRYNATGTVEFEPYTTEFEVPVTSVVGVL